MQETVFGQLSIEITNLILNMVISQKAKNTFNGLCIYYATANFIANYDFLVIIML